MVAIFTGLGSGFVRSSAASLGGTGVLGSAALGRIGEGVSLNAATGNLVITQQDEFLTGLGLDVSISRTYNSSAETGDRDNGDNWQMGTVRRVFGLTGTANTAGSTVKRLSGDGSVVTYTYGARLVAGSNVSAYWATAGDGAHEKLIWDGALSNWRWTDGSSQTEEVYEAAVTAGEYRIRKQSDLDLNRLLFTYAAGTDLLDKVTNQNGEWVQYTWSGTQLSRVSTGIGGVTSSHTWYVYTGGKLSEVRVDMTPGDNLLPDQTQSYWTQYTYDANGRLSRILQKDGSQVDIVYDGSGRVTSVTQQADVGQPRVTSLVYSAGFTTITAPDGQATRLDYDAAGQLTKITAPPAVSGAAAQVVQFFYDADGNLTKTTDPNLKDSLYTYDAQGNLLQSTDPNGNAVLRWYDAGNRVVAIRNYATDNGVADVAQYTRYVYDIEGHLRYLVSAEGRVTEYRYTAAGQVEYTVEYPEHAYTVAHVEGTILSEATMDAWRNSIADKQSIKVSYATYDGRGNATSLLSYGYGSGGAGTAGSGILTEGWSRTNFTYDAKGRLLSRNEEGRTAQTYVYDSLGRVTSMVDPQGGSFTIVFNDAASQTVVTTAMGYTTTQTFNKAGELIAWTGTGNAFDSAVGSATANINAYDKNGRLRVSTDATGYKTYYIYDKAGRLSGTVNHLGGLTEYRYDAANRLIAETRYYNALSAATLTTLANPYNTFELTAATRPAADAKDLNSWSVYDAGGRLIQSIAGDGSVAAYEYDKSNRLIKTTVYATKVATGTFGTTPPTSAVAVTSASADVVTRSFFDGDGLLTGALDGEGYLVEFVYDKDGQKVEDVAYATKTSSALWASGSLDQLRSSAGTTARRTRYTYDGEGNLRYATDNAGRVTSYTYDTAGNLLTTRAHANTIAPADYTYDAVKAAATTNANDRVTTLTYYATGKVATSTDAVGTVTTFTYQTVGGIANAGNLVKAQIGSGTSARITRNYYNAEGLLRFTVDAEGFVRRYDYDLADRKVREVLWDNPIAVSDATTIDNVNALAGGTFTDYRWEYDSAGRVVNEFDGENNRTAYQYYNTGQLYVRYDGADTPDQSMSVFVYDGAGRLSLEYRAWADSEQTMTAYGYDGLGNRITMTDPRGVVTTYGYDEVGQVTSMTEAAGTGIARTTNYTYNAFGEVLTVTRAGVLQSTTVYDALGRVSSVTDAGGYVTSYGYTQFGELQSVTRAGATTAFEYDKLGRVTKSTDALGFYETYAYDALGNRISKTAKSATGTVQAGGTTTYTYDRRGLLLTETLPVKSFDNSGNASVANISNSYSYDSRGNLKTKVEAAGMAEARTTQYVYDKANRLKQTIGQTYHGITPNSYVYYDARGNVTSTVASDGARTVYYYDDLNRVTVEISPVGTYTAYTYDQNGNVASARVYGTAITVPADGGAEHEAPAPLNPTVYRETTFTYDQLNRMTSSKIAGVTSGSFNGTAWVSSTADIIATYEYDANGNVTKTTDPQGNVIWSYYDALNRKVAQVDGEGYLTTWDYNADGNVTREYRHATRMSSIPAPTSPTSAAARTNLSYLAGYNAVLDRYTDFTYDAVGNRTSEARANVQVHNGAGGYTQTTATIYYLYNGLGQVTRKTEASQDQVNYTYDAGGRLTSEARAAFIDQSGTSVTPTVDYYYDGLGNLSRTRARGSANAAERVTTYGYDGGKLRWMRDAEWQDGNVKDGKMTWYWYDYAGRLNHEYYERYDSNGALTKAPDGATAAYEGVLTSYDLAGRVSQKWQAAWNGSAWVEASPRMATTYNAYGEVDTVTYGGVLQQTNQYDNAGRLIATNSGDGAWKYFGYDRNGNQTVAITSAGANLTGQSFAGALALVGQADVNATYTRYDKRNMATIVTEEGRQFSIGGIAQTLNTERTYNAFGEVASEKNAAGAQIDYTYNTMGRLIKTESPLVEITLENGAKTNVRPTEQYYYDASGRLVATRDANNNLNRLTLLAGTGYGGSQALVTSETHADGGIKTTKYDIHGDAREQVNELGRSTLLTYDKMGRMIQRQEVRNAANTYDDLIEGYAYDGLGQQLKRWNNVFQTPVYGEPYWVEGYYDPYDPYGNYGGYWEYPIIGYTPEYEVTNYDIQGRVVSARAFGGDTTTTSYAWEAGTGTSGVGTFGAWAVTTTMANGLYSVQKSDLAGRAVYKRDLGGNITSFTYDAAGRMASTTMNGLTTSVTWLNSGLVGRQTTASPGAGTINTTWSRDVATYSYDISGNRLTEQFNREQGVYTPGYMVWYNPYEPDWIEESYYEYTTTIKNASATYDALGRMRTWAEAGTATAPAASIANEYDAAGNVRRTNSSYRSLDANGAASSVAMVRDYWFRYDSMNRVIINQGVFDTATGTIVRGAQIYGAGGGQEIAYNQAGQRTSVTVTNAYANGYYGYTYADTSELYSYDEAGRLIQSREVAGTPAAGPGTLRSIYGYDLLGRQTSQSDYNSAGTQVVYSRTASFDQASRLTSDYTSNLKTDGKTYTSSTSYSYYGSQGYMLGAVTSQSSSNWVSGGSTTYSSTTNTYVWFDGALQSTISYKPNTSQSTTYTTTFGYNSLGQLTSAYIADGKPHSVTFTNDELGQIVRRDESNISGQTGAPHEVWYRFNGRQLGYTGNNGTTDMSMAASISDRQVVSPTNQGTFRNKQMVGSSYADFAQNYDPINSFSQGSAGGTYTVQRGDTLQSIAQNLWGDSSLWYKIAEANGLGASSGLVEGQRLTLPTGVIKNTNNAGTSNPYNPAEAMGDLSPSTSPKPKGKKCGGLGMIFLAVIAIAVATIVTAGAASLMTGASFSNALGAVFSGSLVGFGTSTTVLTTVGAIGAAATGAVAGSIISQAVGVATGIQDKFSWKAVALAGIGSFVGGAIGANFGGGGALGAAGRAAASSAITQGIGVATGLQDKFSWVGVVAAAVGAGVGHEVSSRVGGAAQYDELGNLVKAETVGHFASVAAAEMLSNAATRSALTGTSFGDNILAALPDVLASVAQKAIGNAAFKVDAPEDVKPTATSNTSSDNTAGEAVSREVAAKPATGGAGGVMGLMGMAGLAYLPSLEDILAFLAGIQPASAREAQAPQPETGSEGEIVVTARRLEKYTVRSGDTLSGIATRRGTTVENLLRYNDDRISDPDRINVGDVIYVPRSASSVASTASTPSEPAARRTPVQSDGGHQLGDLSSRYESRGDVGTVSSGVNDPGGVSYGLYQLTTKKGDAARFIASPEAAPWADDFRGLRPGSPEFGRTWRRIAAAQPEEFGAAQHAFVKRSNYDPVVADVERATGFNLGTSSVAVQDVTWSIGVQHGGSRRILTDAIRTTDRQLGRDKRGTPEYENALINNMYDRRISYVSSLRQQALRDGRRGDASTFANILRTRYPAERADALRLQRQGR